MKPVIINLDGKNYELKYDFNSLVILEEMGISIDELQNGGKFPLRMLRGMLYAGLLHENNLSELEVGSMIKPTDFQNIAEKIGEALTEAFGEAEKNLLTTQKKKK